jgi:hypothetical protein
MIRVLLFGALALATVLPRAAVADAGVGHVTGIGGVFVKSKDPRALAAWYHDMLGVTLEPWGGAKLRYDAPLHPPSAAWIALSSNSKYTAPDRASSCWISRWTTSMPSWPGLRPRVLRFWRATIAIH